MNAQISTLFYWCNDIDKTRTFYTEVLGLKEIDYRNDARMGWLSYALDNLAVNFLRASTPLGVITEWARQPGWTGGTLETPSLVLQVSLADFEMIVDRAQKAGVTLHAAYPQGAPAQYLQHFLMDPMGNTVELYYEAKGS